MSAPIVELDLCPDDAPVILLIVKDLISAGCCYRCILRFVGEKQHDVFRKSNDDIIQQLTAFIGTSLENCENNGDTSNKRDDSPCIACLGILVDFSSPDFLCKIKTEVGRGNFDYRNFYCSLSVPIATIVREHSILLYLREKYNEFYKTQENIVQVKDAWKWRNGPLLEALLNAPFEPTSPFKIAIMFSYRNSDKECNFLTDLHPEIFKKRKQRRFQIQQLFSRVNVVKAITATTFENYKSACACPPARPSAICEQQKITCCHESVYVAGRYNKYTRLLCQTPWMIDGTRKMESSVQEKICETLLSRFKSDDHKFSSSGREDVDVQMLGSGRPFIVEFINPHTTRFSQSQMTEMQKKINDSTREIAVRDLQIVSREDTDILKEGEISKTKSYSALCWSETEFTQEKLDELSALKDVKLFQKTPVRVLHRRPLAVRERFIHSMTATKVDQHHFKLSMSTQAGTYVKEFVHGDFGRTTPNMSTLMGAECDILELDVESVDINWPKKIGAEMES